MKKIFIAFLFAMLVFDLKATEEEQICYLGITFEISDNPSWGYGEVVILDVEPDSPADIAGIQPNDIIMEINGKATYLRGHDLINFWIFDNDADIITFTVRNLNTNFKEYEISRHCHSAKALNESFLASEFSMYSIENTQKRAFILPLVIKTNNKADYSDYRTFDFIKDSKLTDIDEKIKAEVEKVLQKKGFTRETKDPDILIQVNSSYKINPKFSLAFNDPILGTWRYDDDERKMVSLPFVAGDDPKAEMRGQSMLEFKLRFFEKKRIDPDKLTQIWEGHIIDYLTYRYSLIDYVRIHAPLMLMQFPYSEDKVSAKYMVSFKKYNYTGLYFDMDNVKTIADVDEYSPAFDAGLRQGMVVKNREFSYSKNVIINGYKRFVSETMKYRDQLTKFTDADGIHNCMYWYAGNQKSIRNALKDEPFAQTFSYLYSFDKCVYNKFDGKLVLETDEGKHTVIPVTRTSVTVRSL